MLELGVQGQGQLATATEGLTHSCLLPLRALLRALSPPFTPRDTNVHTCKKQVQSDEMQLRPVHMASSE